MLLRNLQERLPETFETELIRKLDAQIQRGKFNYGSDISLAWDCLKLDSLDVAEFEMQIEALEYLGFVTPLWTVGDLLFLLRVMEDRRQRRK